MNFTFLFLLTILSVSTRMSFGITGVELIAKINNENFVFDLLKSNGTINGKNTIRQLSVSQFPTLANMGISYTYFELAPCGINLPHVHPRATELLYVRITHLSFYFNYEFLFFKNKGYKCG